MITSENQKDLMVKVLKELQSNDKYLEWCNLNEYVKQNGYNINYVNKYTSWLVISEGIAVCINCENNYGTQLIKSFS